MNDVSLGDGLDVLIDHRGKTPAKLGSAFTDAGVPVASAILVKDGRLDLGEARFVDSETATRWMGVPTTRGDVLLTSEAPLGRVARVPSDAPLVLGQRLFGLRGKPGVLDTGYLYYALQSSPVQASLRGHATGTTVLGIRQSALRTVRIPAPSFAEQRAIAEVLGALDDKIAANDRVAALAIEGAEAHFQSACDERVGTANLGDVAELVLGGTPSRARSEYWSEGTVPWLASGKANEERVLAPTEWITEEALEKSAAKWMPVGATILAITGATLGQVARLEIAATGNQSLVGIWHKDRGLNDWLYFAVRASIGELMRHATGAAQQHVNKRDVERLRVPLLEPDSLMSWTARTSPLLGVAASKDRESAVLARTRDELLPLLMSGKVRVRDAETKVEEVL